MKTWIAFALFLLLRWQNGVAADALPDLGDPSALTLSPTQERQLGQSIMDQIRQSLEFNTDPFIASYIQTLGTPLAARAPDSRFPYTYFVINNKQINAFALPGGFIGINTGLLLEARDQDEVASVLAHETAHVSQHHIARMYERLQRVQMSTLAGALASLILATQHPNAGSGALAATLANQQQALINFTRENEQEADRLGIQLLAQAQFDPQAMPRFFEKLWQMTQYYDNNHIPEYLRTHPLTQARIADSQARAKDYPARPHGLTLTFALIQARIRAASFSTPQLAIQFFTQKQQQPLSELQQSALLYGLSLAELQLNNPRKAYPRLRLLAQRYPTELLIQSTCLQSLYQLGRTDEALRQLAKLRGNHPDNKALLLQYNGWLLTQNQPQTVVQTLRHYQLSYGASPETLQQLSQAYAALGDNTLMHFSQADYLLSIGDYRGALHHLEQAQHSAPPKDAPIAFKITARISEVQETIKNLEGTPLEQPH